jgi:hypothetical protein
MCKHKSIASLKNQINTGFFVILFCVFLPFLIGINNPALRNG